MANPHSRVAEESESPAQTPLLAATDPRESEKQQEQEQQQGGAEVDPGGTRDAHLGRALEWLELFLYCLGFNQSSVLRFVGSWAAFMLVGVAVPVVGLEVSNCSDDEKYQIKDFEVLIVVSQASLAAVSLLCLSHNFRKYGVRKFLFMDRSSNEMVQFCDQYILKIRDSMRLLIFWILPCFILKVVREVIRIIYVPQKAEWLSAALFLALTVSWTYVTLISLSASILFHLVCNLQVIHFENYGKLLERDYDILVFIMEHIRLRNHLSKISHRFRIYLLLEFMVVTVSQLVTLVQTTGDSEIITFLNGGDFAVSSIVQVVEITLCLHAATKISHRAQNIASLASRWHALVTCTCGSIEACQMRISNIFGNLEAATLLNSLCLSNSESDLESLDSASMPTNTQLTSSLSSYHKRQAFVMYLQSNPGGITIFGWTVDRALINTIFCIQLTLITFVLGKTIAFT